MSQGGFGFLVLTKWGHASDAHPQVWVFHIYIKKICMNLCAKELTFARRFIFCPKVSSAHFYTYARKIIIEKIWRIPTNMICVFRNERAHKARIYAVSEGMHIAQTVVSPHPSCSQMWTCSLGKQKEILSPRASSAPSDGIPVDSGFFKFLNSLMC